MTFSVRQTTREKFDCFDLSFNSSMVLRIHMVRRTLMKSMFISFFVVLLLSMLFPGCLCLGSDTILAGQSLFPNETIISQGGIFELGFFSPGKSTNYYVGIWYKKISVRTVVWVANRNNPISYSLYNDSRLEMLKDGNLRLIGNSKTNWVLETSYATEAVILDTGNFVLRNASGIIIWQSFDYPTDTWLPGGKVGLRLFSDIETKLVSWSNPEDPGMGNFSLGMQSDGFSELFIKRNDFKLWRSGVWQGGNFNGLFFGNLFNFTYVSKGDSVYLVFNVFNSSLISRIELTYSGLMRLSTWIEAAQIWSVYWMEPSDACGTYAMCGSNAICDINNLPPCSCLTGFEPKVVNDWDRFDFSSGCVRKQPKCSDENDFFKLSNIRLPENPESLGVTRPKICELACGSNCSCNAYAYSTEGGCLLFNGELLDLESLSNNSAGRDLYIRMDTALSSSRGKGNLNVPRLALVVPFSVIFVVCIILLFCFWRKRKNKVSQPGADLAYQNLLLLNLSSNGPENNKRPAERTNGSGEEKNNKYELPTFSFSSIVEATNDFSITNKLGEGGFGPVYKGELLNEQFVAVKRLSRRSNQGLEEFKNETELIAKLQHKNLVGVLGCCIENEEKILIYEYMPNQSLDIFLFDPTKKEQLDLARRVHIIEGIAQGLLYLHHYSRLRIIHRDLKASNVLLDAEMNPKISDFGMARIFGGTDLQANTKRIVGTYGYMSPEYAMGGIFSIKSDVYAFGVLLLEILSGKKNTGFYDSDYLSLLGYAWNMWTNNRGLDLVDPSVEIISSSSSVLLRYIQIALLCVEENPGDRPTMLDVVAMFNKEQKAVASPKHPAFSVGGTLVKASPGGNKLEICSVNGLTVSVMEAR